MRIKVESPTIWGYDQDDIKLARKLMEYGITPRELKEHLHDFAWVTNVVVKENQRLLDNAIKSSLEGFNATRD